MKFKIIFILFNIVVLFSLAIITIMPVLMLGGEYGSLFWSGSWYYVIAFLLIIGIIDSYFIYNWKLFDFLESEKWKELEVYLEKRMKQDRIPAGFIVRIMINTYMMNGHLKAIEALGMKVLEKKPALFRKLFLSFSVPVLLESNPEKMEEFFKPYVGDKKIKEQEWVLYLYAFSLILQKKNDEALGILAGLCKKEKISPVLLLLSLYSLSAVAEEVKERDCVEEGKKRLKSRFTREVFKQEIDKERSNVIVAVLSTLCKDALDWLFEEE